MFLFVLNRNSVFEVMHSVYQEERNFFYLMMHLTHFMSGYMASDIWKRTTQIVREKTCCHHYMDYSFWIAPRVVFLYGPSHRHDSTYHSLCYTIQIVRDETCCCHMGYSFQLAARVLLYASSHRLVSTYHSLCYTSRGARNSSMGRKEGNVLFNDALNTFYFTVIWHWTYGKGPLR